MGLSTEEGNTPLRTAPRRLLRKRVWNKQTGEFGYSQFLGRCGEVLSLTRIHGKNWVKPEMKEETAKDTTEEDDDKSHEEESCLEVHKFCITQ